ncbi:MAG: sodium:melibiose symporter, partial [Parasphingopyxis sp.]
MASTTAGAGTTENPSVPPLGFGTKFSYGFGAIANGVKNAAFATYLMLYFNQVVGVPAGIV